MHGIKSILQEIDGLATQKRQQRIKQRFKENLVALGEILAFTTAAIHLPRYHNIFVNDILIF